jgi:hypothetical protein
VNARIARRNAAFGAWRGFPAVDRLVGCGESCGIVVLLENAYTAGMTRMKAVVEAASALSKAQQGGANEMRTSNA